MEEFPNAEICGPFIRLVLDELNCNVLLYDREPITSHDDLEKYPGHYGGLYIFYLKPDIESEIRFPVYVGTTRQSFRERFRRHAIQGLIKKMWGKKFPTNVTGLGLYVWCTHFQGAPARRIKNILLDSFNFALDQGRMELDTREQYPAEWTNNNLKTFPWDKLSAADEENTTEDTRLTSEKAGPFIRFILDHLNCNVDLYDQEEIKTCDDLNKFPGHYGGMYLFFMKPDPTSELRYPIYVGVTKQSFKERFQKHAHDDFNGALYNIWNGKFEGLGVYAICAKFQGKQAKILKKFLHEYFNFPLKRNRFGELRSRLETAEQYPVEYIQNNLDIPWEKCVEKVKEVTTETRL